MADACDDAFDAARVALESGATGLSLGGALADVECSVAYREAMTAASLLHDVIVAASRPADGAMAASAAVDAADEAAVLQAARNAIEAVEPGYLANREREVFISGVGLRDASGQQAARKDAAAAYLAARGGESGP